MTDTPPPPDLVPPPTDPAPPTAPPKRPWTILGRLSKAVREQNWFAVVLELLIVIAGVVVGFQITVWRQDRADRARLALQETFGDVLTTNWASTWQYRRLIDQARAITEQLRAAVGER